VQVNGIVELHDQGTMTWTEREHGWVAGPDEVLNALAGDGFEECSREMTTGRRDLRPARRMARRQWGHGIGGLGDLDCPRHSAPALVFIELDGELIKVDHGGFRRPGDASYRDEGGES